MTTPNAYAGDALLKGATYSKAGGYCVRLEIERDGWENLMNMEGQHFAVVFVPVANDGTPDVDVIEKAETKAKPKGRSRAQEAGRLCNDVRFWGFLNEHFEVHVSTTADAAIIVRTRCFVASRKDFDRDAAAGERWDALKDSYDGEFA